jgi:hypothetical protein
MVLHRVRRTIPGVRDNPMYLDTPEGLPVASKFVSVEPRERLIPGLPFVKQMVVRAARHFT